MAASRTKRVSVPAGPGAKAAAKAKDRRLPVRSKIGKKSSKDAAGFERNSIEVVKKEPVIKREPSKTSLSGASASAVLKVNRAPVLTLWMTVCLRRLRYAEDTCLSVAKVVTGRCASAKGKSLGIFQAPESGEKATAKKPAAVEAPEVCTIAGHKVPLASQPDGSLLATSVGSVVNPKSVETYLNRAFKGDLTVVRSAMQKVASSYSAAEIQKDAMQLYERFRPAWKGWGVPGDLHLKDISAAAK